MVHMGQNCGRCARYAGCEAGAHQHRQVEQIVAHVAGLTGIELQFSQQLVEGGELVRHPLVTVVDTKVARAWPILRHDRPRRRGAQERASRADGDSNSSNAHDNYLTPVPLTPLIGHTALRARLDEQVRRGTLASSILFTGPAGIGKQRLALWLAQRLLCEEAASPCGSCQHCRYAAEATHPDLLWVFPMRNLKDSDAAPEDVAVDYAEAIAERVAAGGVYERPDGSAGIFKYTTRLLVQRAARTPALARRKVFVVGDAERMVSQAASQEAANMFLKLLEEPPANTTLLLTSSEPGALLPTIRSRVIAMRVRPLAPAEMREFLALPAAASVAASGSTDELVALAHGAPGALLDAEPRSAAVARAGTMLDAATRSRDRMYRVAYAQGGGGARGGFSDALEALTELLHARSRAAADAGDATAAAAGARAMLLVEHAKRDAERNAAPQLVAFSLLTKLSETLP